MNFDQRLQWQKRKRSAVVRLIICNIKQTNSLIKKRVHFVPQMSGFNAGLALV